MALVKLLIVFLLCVGIGYSMTCRKNQRHLDCRNSNFIRGLDATIDTVLVGDNLFVSEFLRHDRLDEIIVIVRGMKHCYIVCLVATQRWIHPCICQVCIYLKNNSWV